MVSITIENVVKTFGTVRAVDDVSLKIETGELFFLLGPSGCGKTTLLRLIAGFYHPDGGRILFDETDISQTPPHKRNTGMVFQNYALWPHMTVRENLTFGLEMRHVSTAERKERVERALEMVQMLEYANRSPNQLSGGQQQRVALGRALVLEPDVVLMDEPLSNLDAKLRLEMREQIKRIHEQLGLTMVYVTHDQEEALSMADRMVIMHRGRIGQVGTPRGIYNRPGSRFIADFIGETNLIGGEIQSINEQATVTTPVGDLVSTVFYDGAKVGDTVLCSIRPERLDVLTEAETRPNVLNGEVLRVVYLGDHEQYFVKLSDGTELKSLEFDTDSPKVVRGTVAKIGCEPKDVVLLPGA
jgi:iron(III) transport system ATP-binding protein